MKQPVYVIAEIGVNHNGDYDRAISLIDVAVKAGANAVKFQSFVPEKLAARNLKKADYQHDGDSAPDQLSMLQNMAMPEQWYSPIIGYCKEQGVDFLSTAFDQQSLQLLNKHQVKTYKVASGEITNLPLLWQTGQFAKNIILSTGMSNLADIELALANLAHSFLHQSQPVNTDEVFIAYHSVAGQAALSERVTILHCTSQYPAPDKAICLNALETIANAFKLPVGYSDHSQDLLVSSLAVAKGATIIEKHITLSHDLPGPDHKASLEPHEFYDFVKQIRRTELILGSGVKSAQSCELQTKLIARQTLVASMVIKQGELFSLANLTTQRTGIDAASPTKIWDLLNTPALKTYQAGDPID